MMKRKIKEGEREELSNSSSLVQLKRRRLLNSTSFSELENFDDHRLASCSRNVSSGVCKEKLTTIDLQEVNSNGVEMAITATFNVEQTERNQTTSFSNLEVEETELESTATPPSTAEAKMVSDSELEEFFSAAEKDIQNQFSKKYNFDVVSEEALEGRFEWVRVNP